jgi:predicted amidohydrolase
MRWSGAPRNWRANSASTSMSARRPSRARRQGRQSRLPVFASKACRIATYDKIHMFDVDLDNGESWRESATYEPGRRRVVAELPFGNLGMAVCYDLRFPQLFRAQALAGAMC